MAKILIHNDSRFFNTKLTIPIDGTVQLGPKGEVTVSNEAAKLLLTIANWIDPAAQPFKKPETAKESPKKSKLVMEEVSKDSASFGIDLDKLTELDREQLLEIAATAEIDVPEIMQGKQKSLASFLKNQLKKKFAE